MTRVLSSLQIAFEGYQGLVGCHRQRPSTRTIKKTRTICEGTIKPDIVNKAQTGQNPRLTNVLYKCFCISPLFDHEKLDVYCLELQFVAWIADFFDDVSRCSHNRTRTRPRTRILFRRLVLPIALCPDNKQLLVRYAKRTIGHSALGPKSNRVWFTSGLSLVTPKD